VRNGTEGGEKRKGRKKEKGKRIEIGEGVASLALEG